MEACFYKCYRPIEEDKVRPESDEERNRTYPWVGSTKSFIRGDCFFIA
jgi:hypothetical protein